MTDANHPPLAVLTSDDTGLTQSIEPRWTRQRMVDFLQELAACRNVAEAARAVGMSRQSVYKLRARNKGQYFDTAWTLAMRENFDALHGAAIERATNGIEVPVYHKGELVATRRHFDERLTCFLLSQRNRLFRGPTRKEYELLQIWEDDFLGLIERIATRGVLPPEDED